MENVYNFLYEQVGYKKVEELIKTNTISLFSTREFLCGTVLGSWPYSNESSISSFIKWPRIPIIRESKVHFLVMDYNPQYKYHLFFKNFFVGYTPDGIDGFIKTARKGYFPNAHAELKDPEHVEQRWKAVLTCPDIELIIHGSKVKKPKYCTMNFFLEDLLVEKINKITREYYMRIKNK